MPPPSLLLAVDELRVTLATARGEAHVLRDVSFSMARGGTLGLIGESGCGKSMTALALMGLLPDGARVQGSIKFDGHELVGLHDAPMQRLNLSVLIQKEFRPSACWICWAMPASGRLHRLRFIPATPTTRRKKCRKPSE